MSRAASSSRAGFLPHGTEAFLRRRAVELAGIAVMFLGLMLLAMLATYNPGDPSLNTASDGPVRNLFGRPGAYGADLLVQSLGLAGALLGIVVFTWGARVAAHRRLALPWLRVVLLPPALVATATALAALPTPHGWPIASGLGGSAGLLLLQRGAGLLHAATGLGGPLLPGLAAALLALLLLAVVLGFSRAEWSAAMLRLIRYSGFALPAAARRRPAAAQLGWAARFRARHAETRPPARRRSLGWPQWPARLWAGLPSLPRLPRRRVAERSEPFLGDAEPAPRAPVVQRETGDRRLVAPRRDRLRREKAKRRRARAQQESFDLVPGGSYRLPPLSLLARPEATAEIRARNEANLEDNARMLEAVLQEFGVNGSIVKVRPGPVVTLYELEPAPGTKSSRVIGLADDIARSMSAVSVRVAVVPGRNAIGIELPNQQRETVYLRELFLNERYKRTEAKLPLALGKDLAGTPVIVDLARMPHLLVAGTTGSGKSVAINAMILSLLYRLTPEQCQLIMIDPKMLELSAYDDIPHLMAPVVTEPRKAVVALKWAVREMEDRYRAMSKLGVRNIDGYNLRLAEARQRGEMLLRKVQTGFDADTGKPVFEEVPLDLTPLPYIVLVVDEMADLMLIAGKDIEAAIQRLSQMARAAGIHLIMATQRPSVDVITGTIKANFPTRVSFQVTSKIDSRTILGEQGAEQLLGQGDMLYMASGGRITRVHGPFVSDAEVEEVVAFLKAQAEPSYIEAITEEEDGEVDLQGIAGGNGGPDDELYQQAVALIAREGKASTSFVQRHLQIGYNRAARIIERMEAEGLVSPANHVGKREVLLGSKDGG